MIMSFIIGVVINDLSNRSERECSQEAQDFYQRGEKALDIMLMNDSAEDHVPLLIGFLLLYLYIPKRKSSPHERINQFSRTVLNNARKHRLDSRCLDRTFGTSADRFSDKERLLLARLVIWIYDEDVKCSFQSYGGSFAEYLATNREKRWQCARCLALHSKNTGTHNILKPK